MIEIQLGRIPAFVIVFGVLACTLNKITLTISLLVTPFHLSCESSLTSVPLTLSCHVSAQLQIPCVQQVPNMELQPGICLECHYHLDVSEPSAFYPFQWNSIFPVALNSSPSFILVDSFFYTICPIFTKSWQFLFQTVSPNCTIFHHLSS
jgi:hypothetical protein